MKRLYKTEEERKAQRAAYHRVYRLRNPEKLKEQRNKGGKERSRKHYVNNRTKVDEYKRRHREENKEQYNARARERHRKIPCVKR